MPATQQIDVDTLWADAPATVDVDQLWDAEQKVDVDALWKEPAQEMTVIPSARVGARGVDIMQPEQRADYIRETPLVEKDARDAALKERSAFFNSVAAQVASAGLNIGAAFTGGLSGKAKDPANQEEYDRLVAEREQTVEAESTQGGVFEKPEDLDRYMAGVNYRLNELEGDPARISRDLRAAGEYAWEHYNASREAKNPAAQIGRGTGQFIAMLPTMIGTGGAGLPLAAAQAGAQAYSETYTAVENGLRAQGITDEAQIAAQAERAAVDGAAKTFPAMMLYVGAGKLAAGATARMAGQAASPIKRALFGAAGAEVANIGAGTVLRAAEGQDWQPTIETLTMDTLFALYHGLGEYKKAGFVAKERAKVELEKRGADPNVRPPEPQPGQTPAQQVTPKAPEVVSTEAALPGAGEQVSATEPTPEAVSTPPPPLSPKVAASITALPEALFDRGFPEYEPWRQAREAVGFPDNTPEVHAGERVEYEGAAEALGKAASVVIEPPKAEAAPAVETAPESAPIELTQPPKDPNAGKGGPLSQRTQEARDQYKANEAAHDKAFAEWVESIPANKAIVMRDEMDIRGEKSNRYAAVTRDPNGGWRVTRFDEQLEMPSGHEEFKTRLEAAQSLDGWERIAKLPFTVKAGEFHGQRTPHLWLTKPGESPVLVKFGGYLKGGERASVMPLEGVFREGEWQDVEADHLSLPSKEDAKAAKAQEDAQWNERESRRFQPDDELIMHSPHTGEDVPVSYRGPLGSDKSVVWTGKSQMSIPTTWLRRKGAPAPQKVVEPPPPVESKKRPAPAPDSFMEDPIVQFIEGAGGILSKTGAKRKMGANFEKNAADWEDAPSWTNPRHNRIYNDTGNTPNKMHQALVADGYLPPDSSVSDMWAYLGKASKTAASTRSAQAAQRAEGIAEEKKGKAFEKAISEPAEQKINVDELGEGAKFTVDGEEFVVKEIDPDSGDVIVEDGRRFGRQVVESGKTLNVDAVENVEGSTDFVRDYDAVQRDIDSLETALEIEAGEDVRFYHPDTPVDLPNWKPMPPKLAKLYDERDAIGKAEMEQSVKPVKDALSKIGLTDGEQARVLKHYAMDRTDAAGQYLATEHAVETAKGDPVKQAEEIAYALAAERKEMFDELKDVSDKTLRDAAEAVRAVREYFGLQETRALKLQPGQKQGDLLAGSKDDPFNLAGEEGVDFAKRQQEAEAAEKRAAEAKAAQDKAQTNLFGSPERPPTRGEVLGAPPTNTRPVLADVPRAEWDGKRVSAPNVIDALADSMSAFGTTAPLRQGRLTTKGEGEFDPRQRIARIRTVNDITVAAHEVAHGIEEAVFGYDPKLNPWVSPRIGPAVQRELVKLGKNLYPGPKAPTGGWRREGFAEFVRLWVQNPALARSEAPSFSRYFENVFLKDHPEGATALRFARKLNERWDYQGAYVRGQESSVDEGSLQSRSRRAWQEAKEFFSQTGWVDALDSGLKIKRAAEREKGAPLTPDEDFHLTLDALRRTADARVEFMVTDGMIDFNTNKVGPGLEDVARIVGRGAKSAKDFDLYLKSRRSLALWDDPRGPRNPGISREDAVFNVNKLGTPEFQLAAQKYYDWNDGGLNYMAQASPVFAKVVKMIRDRDPGFYAPLQREMNLAERAFNKIGGGSDTRMGRIGRRLFGSGRRVKNVIQSAISNMTGMVRAANERHALDQLLALKDKYPGIADVFEELTPEQSKKYQLTLEDNIKRVEAELKKVGGSILVDDNGADMSAIMMKMFGPMEHPSVKDDYVVDMVDAKGKTRWFRVDKDAYDLVMNTDPGQIKGVFKSLLAMHGRFWRTFTTGLRAPFAFITNPFRDVNTGANQTRSGANPLMFAAEYLRQYVMGAASALTGGAVETRGAEYLRRTGVKMATPLGQDMQPTRRLAKRIFQSRARRAIDPRNWLDYTRNILQFSELAGRATEVELLARNGLLDLSKLSREDMKKVTLAAKRVTADFSAMGRNMREINQIVPFSNAAVQGTRGYLRNWRDQPGRAAVTHGLGAAIAAYLWWQKKDKKFWRESPRGEKYRNTLIPFKDAKGNEQVLRIPRDPMYGGIQMGGMEALLDAAYDKDPKAVLEWGKEFFKHASPDFVPPSLNEVINQAGNWDRFYERTIVPRTLENLSHRNQYNEYTSRLAMALSKAGEKIGMSGAWISPVRIDHAISGLGGSGFGEYVRDIGGTVGTASDKEKDLSDIPVAGIMFQRGGEDAKNPISERKFYDLLDKVHREAADAEHAKTPEQKDAKVRLEDDTHRAKRLALDAASDAMRAAKFMEREGKTIEIRRAGSEAATDIARAAVRAYGEKHQVTIPPTAFDTIFETINLARGEGAENVANVLKKRLEGAFKITESKARQAEIEAALKTANEIKEGMKKQGAIRQPDLVPNERIK